MLKPKSCSKCPACKITKKSLICKVGKMEASCYEQEMAMYRKCPLDWEKGENINAKENDK